MIVVQFAQFGHDPAHWDDHSLLMSHNVCIAHVNSDKYLGVHIDCYLSWKDHVNSVCSRIQQTLYFLRRFRVFWGGTRCAAFLYGYDRKRIVIRNFSLVWELKCLTESKAKQAGGHTNESDGGE